MTNTSLTYWLVFAVFVAGCATVPYTNRKKLDLISESQEMQLGEQAFADVRAKSKVSADPAHNDLVKRIGNRIASVAEKPNYKWEFIVIEDDKTPNAFCLPGGKVAVYTGLLPITKDENGLAVVMSHEVAHALAGHGAERMSEGMLMEMVGTGAVVTGAIKTEQQMQAVQMAYGVGRGLPHGRKQETEADRIGLILMAKAGYDPHGAVSFWQRMRDASGGGKPPEWLSTHPSDETRIRNIQNEFIPEAMKYYKPQ